MSTVHRQNEIVPHVDGLDSALAGLARHAAGDDRARLNVSRRHHVFVVNQPHRFGSELRADRDRARDFIEHAEIGADLVADAARPGAARLALPLDLVDRPLMVAFDQAEVFFVGRHIGRAPAHEAIAATVRIVVRIFKQRVDELNALIILEAGCSVAELALGLEAGEHEFFVQARCVAVGVDILEHAADRTGAVDDETVAARIFLLADKAGAEGRHVSKHRHHFDIEAGHRCIERRGDLGGGRIEPVGDWPEFLAVLVVDRHRDPGIRRIDRFGEQRADKLVLGMQRRAVIARAVAAVGRTHIEALAAVFLKRQRDLVPDRFLLGARALEAGMNAVEIAIGDFSH